jgi:hypothetical protein
MRRKEKKRIKKEKKQREEKRSLSMIYTQFSAVIFSAVHCAHLYVQYALVPSIGSGPCVPFHFQHLERVVGLRRICEWKEGGCARVSVSGSVRVSVSESERRMYEHEE